jgi:Cation transport ATPase
MQWLLKLKHPDNFQPFMFSGSSVQNGQGSYMVIAVGVNSENGRIQALIRGQKLGGGDDTPKDGEGGESGGMTFEY